MVASTIPRIRVVGEYRLVDLLGRGGMGEVYRAVHLPSGRIVAVKMLTEQSAEIVQRFENEARLQGSLTHVNIARVEAFFQAEGRYCLVMEYVEGRTLGDLIEGRRGLDVREAFTIFRSIVAATAHLHAAGIVHRDLKPTNIRITSAGEVKLLDFGVAKGDYSPALTRLGNVVGTPLYLSPEQMRSGPASPLSDVWALGILFYEMLAGHPPFEAATFPELWSRVKEGRVARIADGRAVPASDSVLIKRADRLIAECLSRVPQERPAAARLLRAVDRALAPSWFASVAHSLGPQGRKAWPPGLSKRAAGAAVALLVLAALLVAVRGTPNVGGKRPEGAPVFTHTIDVLQGRASVFVNGEFRGTTPLEYEATPGEIVNVELRQTGYETLRTRFDLTTRRSWTLTMRTLPERMPPP